MSDKPKTISEIAASVNKGLQSARAASDDTDLDKVIDELEKTWDVCCERFIIMFVGIAAFQYRTKEQTIQQLERYKSAIENGQHASLFAEFEGKVC